MASTKVFVGSLPPNTKPEELRHLFENYGIVVECDIMNRCGFVHMKNPVMAARAIIGLNATDFKGQKIVVEPGRTRENESVQRVERCPITHYAGRGGFKNLGRDHTKRFVPLGSNYGNTQEVNNYHHYHHRQSIDDFYEKPNLRSNMQINYCGDSRDGRMYRSPRSNLLKSNKPAPYYKPINNVNTNHSFEDTTGDKYDNYDKYYYGLSVQNSRTVTNITVNDSPPNNCYMSKIYARNGSNSDKYDNIKHNWNSNDHNNRDDNSSYNYSTSERNRSTDYYHHNRQSDDTKRNTAEFHTDDLNSASFKMKTPHSNNKISSEQRDRRRYALSRTSNDRESYNNWRQQDITYREMDYAVQTEKNHSAASNMYNTYNDIRGRGDYRNVIVDYDSLNYRGEYPPLLPSAKSYKYNTNNQQPIGYSNRPNIPQRR